MKSYLTWLSVFISMNWLIALNRTLAALYSDGVWGMAYFWWFGSALVTGVAVRGFFAVRGANESESPLLLKAERWGLFSAVCSLILSVFFVCDWWQRLLEPQVALLFKIVQTLLTGVYCVGALLQFREKHDRWQRARQVEAAEISKATP